MNKDSVYNKLLKVFGLLVFLLLVLYLVLYDIGWLGMVSDIKKPGYLSSFVSDLFPANRLETKDQQWQVISEPVYFTTRLPNNYNQAILDIWYQGDCCEIIKIGLQQTSDNEWAYNLQTLHNKSFNNLPWPYVTEDEYTLWQRQLKYSSIADWLKQKSDSEPWLGYNSPIENKFRLDSYSDYNRPRSRQYILRGGYSFYTYIDDKLDIVIELQDLNRTDNEDNVIVNIYDENDNLVLTDILPDDGLTTAYDPQTPPRELVLESDLLAPGLYKVELLTNYDIFTRSITMPHKYLVFINQLYLANSNEYQDGIDIVTNQPTNIITNSSEVAFSTSHFAGLQTVWVNDEEIAITELHKKYKASGLSGISNIKIPNNDLMMVGNGLFALDEDDWFMPSTEQTEIVSDDLAVDYFIAKYKLPDRISGWYRSRVYFNLKTAALNNGKLRFIISAPGVTEEKPLLIKQIDLYYKNNWEKWDINEFISYLKYWFFQR